jgi:hypothetical protein
VPSFAHLARRFVGSLRPGGPAAADVAWVQEQLLPGEWPVWSEMPGPDRRHSVGVARRVAAAVPDAGRPLLAAALLHDVGKTRVGLRTPGRVVATLVGMTVGHDRATKGDGRIARYLRHDQIGADLLEQAGSDALTVAWTREHHLPAEQWSVPRELGDALQAADDD